MKHPTALKATLLFCASWILFQAGFSQVPASFPDSSASWNVEFWESPDPNLPLYYYYYRYFLNGDTLINGQTYARLFEAQTNVALIDTSAATYIGGFREDSTQKVFFRGPGPSYYPIYCDFPATNNQEFLLYDFGRAVGDTFFVAGPNLGAKMNVVEDIDTVTYGGVLRRRFTIRQNGEQVFHIEGIGSEKGPFYPFCEYFEWDWTLLCFSDSSISYNPFNSNCFLMTNLDEGLETPKVTISPHPTGQDSRLTIEAEGFAFFDLQIYDLKGRLLYQEQLGAGESLAINRLGLRSGMYLYRIGNAESRTQSGQLMVR